MENIMKLQRDMQNKVIGGVCSGLANYFGIDAALVRLFFAISILCFGTGFWLYVILWIIMPAGYYAQADYYASPTGSEGGSFDHRDGSPQTPNPNRGSLIAGLVLIGIGAVGLLHRYVPDFNWSTAWPFLLIALGLILIIPFKGKKS